jgi:phage terminase large subunit
MSEMIMRLNEAYVPFLEWQGRYAILMGGAGSGKSYSATQKLLLRMTTENGVRILVIRKVARTIRQSCFKLFVDLINEYDLAKEFSIKETDMSIKHVSGNEMIFAGVDDPEKLKSIAGVSSVWVEEATELDEADFNQLELRVRGETESYKQFVITFNPISEEHWLKARFFDREDIDVLSLKTTYRDNAFLDAAYVHHLEERVAHDEGLYRVYVLGEWGRPRTGGEFYRNFSGVRHITDCVYNPNLPLHLAFDFNVRPYSACIVCQLDGKDFRIVDEICLPHPKNRTADVCAELRNRFANHVSGVYIYGDASGHRRDTRSEEGHNDYSIIKQGLAAYKPAMRVPTSNPSVAMRGNFINSILAGNYDGITFEVNRKCRRMVDDLNYLRENADGTKMKEKGKDELGPYEKYGHCFVGETMITTIDGDKRIDEIKIGDMVLTRAGFKKVINTLDQGIKEVKTYMINDNMITCTPDHKFYTKEHGFLEISKLTKQTLCFIDGEKESIITEVLTDVDQVYDITVEDEHEFFANGVLVHNCSDALDYVLTTVFSVAYDRFQRGPGTPGIVLGKAIPSVRTGYGEGVSRNKTRHGY